MSGRQQSAPEGVATIPDGLPLLSAGKHRSPDEGACFMELASVLAGEAFSDRPRCTHPLLAEVARRVNDTLDDVRRQRLVTLVPAVVGVKGHNPAMTAALVQEVTLAALSVQSQSKPLRKACRRATRRGHASGPGRCWALLTETGYVRGAATRAATRAVENVHHADPEQLIDLLASAIQAAHDAHTHPRRTTAPQGHNRVAKGRRVGTGR